MTSVLLTFGAALLGVTTLYQATDGLQAITAEGARRVAVARHQPTVPAFTLQDMTGAETPIRPQNGETVLVEFIYTTCPTICQTAGGAFAELRDELVAKDADIRMLSISFDPETDTLPAMRDYAHHHGATGAPWTVARVQATDRDDILDFFNVTVIPDEWGGFQHNTAVLMIDPRGRHTAVFDIDTITQIAEAVAP